MLKVKVSPQKRTKVLQNHFNKIKKSPIDNIKFTLNEGNLNVWYAIIYDLSDEFKDGEYLMRLEPPTEYPFKPPAFYFLTPNGVYTPEEKVCLSIGDEHSENYRPSLGIPGFAVNVLGALIGWKDLTTGINDSGRKGGKGIICNTNETQIKKYASVSQEYNKKKLNSYLKMFEL